MSSSILLIVLADFEFMNIYKVFLASSCELTADRKEFEVFLSRLNKTWRTKGVEFELDIWEDFLDSVSEHRKQEDYNSAVRQSDIFVLLFFTKVGKCTSEEFDVAYNAFLNTGKPRIFTYYKDSEIMIGSLLREEIISMFDFLDKIKSIGHFLVKYKNTEALLLDFHKQLDKLLEDNFIITDTPVMSDPFIFTTMLPASYYHNYYR